MSETGKPRHIRDIAHLYLSRLQSNRPAAHDRLVVCGESRNTFPAFHTASLSAAFALNGCAADSPLEVTVFDTSGVLPNAGYYFALPARTYLARSRGEHLRRITALVGVTLHLGRQQNEPERFAASAPRLAIHHIPPFEDGSGFRHALAELRRAPAVNTVFLYIIREGEQVDSLREAVGSCLADTPVFTLGVGTGSGEFVAGQVGTVAAWESSVSDRMPVVCRDPAATLTRRYHSIREGLIYKIRENRRRHGGTGTGGHVARLDTFRSDNR